jgi:hypothetical protein
MVILKKILTISLITLILASTEAHARFQMSRVNQPPSLYHPQITQDIDVSSRVYQQLRYLLGERLYTYLLESDDFLRLQDLTANFIEKSYPVSHPRRRR